MAHLVVLLVLLVACPGTPPGNFVRDATSGEIVKSGAALCALSAARHGADVAVAAAAPPPRLEAGQAIVERHRPVALRASLREADALGARAPPARG